MTPEDEARAAPANVVAVALLRNGPLNNEHRQVLLGSDVVRFPVGGRVAVYRRSGLLRSVFADVPVGVCCDFVGYE